jgi:cell division septum initiation protein DivIVA
LANEFTRFELTRKGYDPLAVERELKDLNLELVRLTETNSELTERLRATTTQLQQSEAALEASKSPNFASLGAKAANILSSAQQIAAELELDAKQVAQQILDSANQDADRVRLSAQDYYESVVEDAARRAQRKLIASEQDADRTLAKATNEADRILREAQSEAARTRGLVATEVAALRATNKRELAAKETEFEATAQAKLAAVLDETPEKQLSEKKLAKLESALKLRRAEAEAEYLEKHREAVAETEGYLNSAAKNMAELTTRVAQLRLEIETLELEAATAQRRIMQEARDKADAVIEAAEIEARNLKQSSKQTAEKLLAEARSEVAILENQSAAIQIYLENLRSLVTGELARRADGTPHEDN